VTDAKLYTTADLAEVFGVSERVLMDWRRQYSWPSVRVGRTIRFTQGQVDAILERHSEAPARAAREVASLPGQTKRSAARRRAS
jgi:uncharacterized protein YjcR